MRAVIRHTATAFTTGAVLAVVIDVVLQLLAGAIRLNAEGLPPILPRLAENSTWVALGLVLWLASPLLGDWIDDVVPRGDVSRKTVWELVALGMLTLPPGHVIGQWMVAAMQMTMAGSWASDAGFFFSQGYLGAVLLQITPWMAAGAVLRGWAHHMIP